MQLQFSWGATRFVVLVGPLAIKFARFRVLWMAKRLFHHMKTGEVKVKFRHQVENPVLATSNIFAGVIANRIECELWRMSPRSSMVPTLFSFGGLVNVQWCGQTITEDELAASHPFREHLADMTPRLKHDMRKVTNFCHYEGRVCLADYGDEELLVFFSDPHPQDAILAAGALTH